ncbi:MAG: efflux RND transporter permease subunit, partial [Oceanicaulis sp.]
MATLFFRFPRLTVLTLFLVVVAGAAALAVVGRQEDPSLTERFGNVIVPFPGADAARVEALVTDPIEAELMELVEVEEVQSISRANIALIDVSVREDLDMAEVEQAWTKIRDAVSSVAGRLPDGAGPAEVDRFYMGAATLMVALRWREGEAGFGPLARLSNELADRLRAVDGTDETAIFGAPEEEVRVTIDPEASAALGLTPADVAVVLSRSDAKTPAGRLSGGALDMTVDVAGAFDGLDRLRGAAIAARDGRFVALGDIARIERAERSPPASRALLNGDRVILVAGYLEPGLQVSAWDARAQDAVAAFAAANPGVEVRIVFAQAEYVVDRLAGLAINLGFSALIVFAVLFLMMGWRAALITGSALPLTVLLVILLINISGEPLHQMSVTGLVVALGLLIDNAIVVVDDYRLLRARGLERLAAMEKAVKTLFGPLLASTLTTIFAFAPIALMPGTAGEFIGMIGTSVIFAVASSFVLAFTVILALAAWFDDGRAGAHDQPWWRDGLRSKPLARVYRMALDGVIAQPLLGLAVGIMLPVAGFAAATTLPGQFFPQTERDMFQLRLVGPPSSSIEETERRVQAATAHLNTYDEVLDIAWVLGESGPRVYYNMIAGVSGRPNYAQGFVRTRSEAATRRIVSTLQEELRALFPESQLLALPFEQGPPAPAPIELTVLGPSLSVLDTLAGDIRLILAGTPGVTFTEAGLVTGEPVARLGADEAEAELAGLRLTDLAGRLRANIDGATGGSVLEGVEELPVRVIAPPDRRRAPDRLGETPLPVTPGEPASSIAAFGGFTLRAETAVITRQNGERSNAVYGFLAPYVLPAPALEDFFARVDEAGLEMPAGYRLEVGGEAENQGEAMADLMSTAGPLLVLMVAAVVLAFNSFRYAAIIFTVGFLSAGLAMFGVWLFGTPLGFNAIVGALGLVGLSINGTIVVLSALRAD